MLINKKQINKQNILTYIINFTIWINEKKKKVLDKKFDKTVSVFLLTTVQHHIYFLRDKPWTSHRDVVFNYCSREWILWLVCVKDIKLCRLWRETTALHLRTTDGPDRKNTDENNTETSQRYGEVKSFRLFRKLIFHSYFQAFSIQTTYMLSMIDGGWPLFTDLSCTVSGAH